VFADCHLFPKPYGLDGARLDALDEMLRYMGIRDKLPADLAGGFDPERLSTGQRKRLALCLAAAEGRPILILDEWAADQDPATRARFYTEILPLLKAKGKTILAITHDERYFGSADARYHMEEGRMLKVSGT
jgi:putative ATP-binding cassette transporter